MQISFFRKYLLAPVTFFTLISHFQSISADPLPYDLIAISYPDSIDQKKLDSTTVKIRQFRVNQAGYRPQDDKRFLFVSNDTAAWFDSFTVINVETGSVAATGRYQVLRNPEVWR